MITPTTYWTLKRHAILTCIFMIALACAAPVPAQSVTTEMEPNDDLSMAQDVGTLMSSITVTGDQLPDVNGNVTADFFSFAVGTGQEVSLRVRTPFGSVFGANSDPLLGLFDATGVLLESSDDAPGLGFDSSIMRYLNPGLYRAAVSSFGDDDSFSGGGQGGFTYALEINAFNTQVAPVPEPTTLLLLCISVAGTGIAAMRRRRKIASDAELTTPTSAEHN